MSEHSYEDYEEVLPDLPNGDLVHWMEARPLTFGPTAVCLAVLGAFALGLASAIAAIGAARVTGAERRMSLPLERKLRRLT
jgi:hypothetical protein